MPSRHVVTVLSVLAVMVTTALGGCLFQNLAPTEQLTDQVYGLNEEARWGRLDLAVRRVSPRYRPAFMASRRSWGQHVAIADTEVSALVVSPGSDEVTSSVEISWYDQRTMELRSTVIRQRWAKTDSGYLLDEETVIRGDAELLEEAEETEEAEEPDATASGEGARG